MKPFEEQLRSIALGLALALLVVACGNGTSQANEVEDSPELVAGAPEPTRPTVDTTGPTTATPPLLAEAPTVPAQRELAVPDWEPLHLPANGPSVYLETVPYESGFLATATNLSETKRDQSDDRLFRWEAGEGWEPLTIPLMPRAFSVNTFEGTRGVVTGWIEPGPDEDYTTQAAVDLTLDQASWNRRFIEPTPVAAEQRYLKRWSSAADATVHNGAFVVLTTEMDYLDRLSFLADNDLGDYRDWQLGVDVVRMWATHDNPEGPHRGQRAAVEIPTSEIGLTPEEIAAIDQTGPDGPRRRLRLLWSEDGETFTEAEGAPLIAEYGRLYRTADAVVLVAIERDGTPILRTSFDGRSFQPTTPPPSSVNAESMFSDGQRLYASGWDTDGQMLFASNEQMTAWSALGPLDDNTELRGAGEVGLAALRFEEESMSVLLSPDGVNWVTLTAEDLFGVKGSLRASVGRDHILIMMEPLNDPHQVRAVIINPDW